MSTSVSWTFIIAVVATWPAYFVWQHLTRAGRADQALHAYHEGYADGYLRGISDRLDGVTAGDQFRQGFVDGFQRGMTGTDEPA